MPTDRDITALDDAVGRVKPYAAGVFFSDIYPQDPEAYGTPAMDQFRADLTLIVEGLEKRTELMFEMERARDSLRDEWQREKASAAPLKAEVGRWQEVFRMALRAESPWRDMAKALLEPAGGE